MNLRNESENSEQYQFVLKGQYTAQTKKQFESLSKFVDSNMFFYMTVNENGLHFISKSKGNVTSNVLRLNRNFFDEYNYREDQFNSADGIAIKMNWQDFDIAYQLLETDNLFCIKCDDSELNISQNFVENYEMEKIMKIQLVHIDEDEIQGISSMQIPIQNILVLVKFNDGDVFTVIDQAFRYLKLENIVICFDFTNEHGKQIHIQNQEQEGGLFKVTLTNFDYKKGAKQLFQIMYDNTLFRRALAFINKNTSVELKVDNNQTLYIISQEYVYIIYIINREANNTYSETLISGKYE